MSAGGPQQTLATSPISAELDGTVDQVSQRPCRRPEGRGVHARMHGSSAFEPHFAPKDLAVLWRLSDTKIRRMFEDEPGVLREGEPSRRLGRKLKRRYFTMRIPESVAIRVHRQLSTK
jgi:hypothetical protein